jgi:alcohol dehydrogenase class IV
VIPAPIVRWGLEELGGVLVDVGVGRPLLVASRRWADFELPVPVQGVWSQVPSADVDGAAREAAGCDGILALGGGSTIDLAKAISAATGLPLVSVPTTYSGAEWTRSFGIRDEGRRMRGGGSGSHNAGIVYDVELTLGLPPAETGGTALNALDHCAEALYVAGRNDEADAEALAGAPLISEWLPRVLDRPDDVDARTGLLEGAAHAGAALGGAGLGLAHALAQAVGGRYGLPHGAMNALCLPPVLRFNKPVAGEAIARFASSMGVDDAAARAEELARLAGFERLRDFGVPREELAELAETAAGRGGNRANPRVATAGDILELYVSIW